MDTRTGPTGGARRVYARRPAAPLPDPTAFQREAFARFVREGLATTLAETPPIRDMRGRVEVALSLPPDAFGRVGRDEEECRAGFHTYAAPLRVRATLTRLDINEVVEKTLSAGDAPTMTPRGTFIVRGVEWLPLAQIVRAPGPYYSIDHRDGRARFLLDLYPARGPKIRLESARDGSIATRIGDAAHDERAAGRHRGRVARAQGLLDDLVDVQARQRRADAQGDGVGVEAGAALLFVAPDAPEGVRRE